MIPELFLNFSSALLGQTAPWQKVQGSPSGKPLNLRQFLEQDRTGLMELNDLEQNS
uniref:Uncharacterized protein n=1 Tax=Cyanothece sp. (strain PCC 7425 / ATCC 29141) TaxID=395961 RepID=B8HQG3_CYAP4